VSIISKMYYKKQHKNKPEQTLVIFLPLLPTKDLLLHRRDVVGKGNLVTSRELENSSFMKGGWALSYHLTPSLLLISMRNCTWIFQSLPPIQKPVLSRNGKFALLPVLQPLLSHTTKSSAS